MFFYFHLNHVGYKAYIFTFDYLTACTFIWTMWDIKILKRILNNAGLFPFHLNHVGYKAIIVEVFDNKYIFFHLNHVGYKVRL